MLLFGELAPGQAVTIQGLVADLDVGMTPVREALRRLTAEGALSFLGNRRITVPLLSLSELDQLSLARRMLEPELASRACERVTKKDIDVLRSIDVLLDQAIAADDMRNYLARNYDFHKALYGLADAAILSSLVDGLWLRFGPSLRGVLATLEPLETPDMHKVLLTALEERDAVAAKKAVESDVSQGMDRLRFKLATAGD
jgi:DNA-binding GntR family transcriptional regulator